MPDTIFPGPGGKTVRIGKTSVHCPANAALPRDLTIEFDGHFYKKYNSSCHILDGEEWTPISWRDVPNPVTNAFKTISSQKRRKQWPQIEFPPHAPKQERPVKTGKTCQIRKDNSTIQMTRRELSDYIEDIIMDNAGHGALHGYSEREINNYINDARQNKRKIMEYFDSMEKPVFDWDITTELPVIPKEV